MGETVTFVKIGSTSDTLYPVDAVAVIPGSPGENIARSTVELGVIMTVLLPPSSKWLPAGVTISERDFFLVRNKEYAVHGRPTEWVSPYGGPGGWEIALKAATG